MEQIYAAFNREVHLFVRINTTARSSYLKAWSTSAHNYTPQWVGNCETDRILKLET